MDACPVAHFSKAEMRPTEPYKENNKTQSSREASLLQKNKSLQKKIDELEQQLAEAVQRCDEEVKAAAAKVQSAEADADAALSEVESANCAAENARADCEMARAETEAARFEAQAATAEAESWRKRFEALQNELPERAEALASAKARELEADLEKAHSCIATLRASKWQSATSERAKARAEAEAEEEEAGERAAIEARGAFERGLLATELSQTEAALQHSSAAAVQLGQKAEQLLMRLTEKTAMAAQQATADLIGASLRDPSLAKPPAILAAAMRSSSSASTGLLTGGAAGAGRSARCAAALLPSSAANKPRAPKEICVKGRR